MANSLFVHNRKKTNFISFKYLKKETFFAGIIGAVFYFDEFIA